MDVYFYFRIPKIHLCTLFTKLTASFLPKFVYTGLLTTEFDFPVNPQATTGTFSWVSRLFFEDTTKECKPREQITLGIHGHRNVFGSTLITCKTLFRQCL